MLQATCLSLLTLCPQAESEQVAEPKPAEAAAQIKAALKAGPGPALASLENLGGIADSRVVKAVALGLRSKDSPVLQASLVALRYNTDPAAAKELLRQRRNKALLEEGSLAAAYYLALGQKADKAAVAILQQAIETPRTPEDGRRAAVLALGRFPTRANIDFLLRYFRSGRRARRAWGNGRIALQAMTGSDPGKQQRDWASWWEKQRSRYRPPTGEPQLDEKSQRQWQRTWQPLDAKGRKERRSKQAEQEKKRQERQQRREAERVKGRLKGRAKRKDK